MRPLENKELHAMVDSEIPEFKFVKLQDRVLSFLNRPETIITRDGAPIKPQEYLSVFPVDDFTIAYKNLLSSNHFQIISEDRLGRVYRLCSLDLESYLKSNRDFKIFINDTEAALDILLDKIKCFKGSDQNHIMKELIDFYKPSTGMLTLSFGEIKIQLSRNIFNPQKTINIVKRNHNNHS